MTWRKPSSTSGSAACSWGCSATRPSRRSPTPPPSAWTRRCWGSHAARSGSRSSHPGGREERDPERSEEHTSELQSRLHLVCRLLLEKKKIRLVFGTDVAV